MKYDYEVQASPHDPLQQGALLPLKVTLYPLGFPLDLATNSVEVRNCACERWGAFPRMFQEAALQFRVLVSDAIGGPLLPPVYRAREHLFTLTCDRDNYGVCDFREGVACAWLTTAATTDPDYLGYFVLDAMAYATVASRHLVCLHAACVAIDDRGLLLCGPSGAGKTCLAYACSRRGFSMVSDDVSSYLRRGRGRTILGKPKLFRFRDSAAEILPELRGLLSKMSVNGKPSIEIRTADLPEIRLAFSAQATALIFLDRGSTLSPELRTLAPGEARPRLERELPVLTWPSYEEQLASLDRLLELPAFDFRYGELGRAVDCLEDYLRNGVGTGR